ncbi:tripartite tricarboxylate transporter TctB family protein [Roseateles albus]|uniref:Tripartite tricarboxylate transporter TctB family protein n=1 Tax=Roseateles albus TaxID=2987525 RepID=A0ABT5KJ22_9BURK|nr:tripartite tricarboxylate transporter TctB family protein [Roseateles albus]MDC8773934.1 tripartite tricarboxylate transporter TctB family protein [Roseateles albus]
MKIKSQRDFFSGLLFVAVGLAFAWASKEYSFGSSAQPGPAYFPFGLGVLLALLGGMVLFKALTIETEDGEPIGRVAWRPLLIIIAAICLFGWMLPRLGLVLTLPAVVLLSSLAGDEFKVKDALLNCALLTFGSWLIFVWGLRLIIPVWPTIFAA